MSALNSFRLRGASVSPKRILTDSCRCKKSYPNTTSVNTSLRTVKQTFVYSRSCNFTVASHVPKVFEEQPLIARPMLLVLSVTSKCNRFATASFTWLLETPVPINTFTGNPFKLNTKLVLLDASLLKIVKTVSNSYNAAVLCFDDTISCERHTVEKCPNFLHLKQAESLAEQILHECRLFSQ